MIEILYIIAGLIILLGFSILILIITAISYIIYRIVERRKKDE